MEFYELTRTLVRRGCPEHPRLHYVHPYDAFGKEFVDNQYPELLDDPRWTVGEGPASSRIIGHVTEDDARAIWTLWALEWATGLGKDAFTLPQLAYYCEGKNVPLLEVVEVATRHLEPKPTHDEEGYPLDQGDSGLRNPIY